MANILDNALINTSNSRKSNTSFTFNTNGKIKPLNAKGTLLPSRIFGSPIEYVKDLKQDVVNIGRAAKGKANDHELGRINDVAMKLGSLALATYLCVKNPLKLSKSMEFVGFGTFFASMALWPKLAIQAPLRARTGVDIHQKYIDSQGRKKMLHQDPQYDLTDLYSREDLDKMGKKLKVSENLPDRDSFIKQRAKKTAIQGNTLWMMTAGFATPIMSALACNSLEKPINNVLEKQALQTTAKAMEDVGIYTGAITRFKDNMATKAFGEFLEANQGCKLDEKMIDALAKKIGGKTNTAMLTEAIKKDLKLLKSQKAPTIELVSAVTNGLIPEGTIANLTSAQKAAFDKALANESMGQVATILSNSVKGTKHEQVKLCKQLTSVLEQAKSQLQQPTVGEYAERLKALNNGVANFAHDKNIIDKFISARVGDKSGTFIANQWDKVSDDVIHALDVKRGPKVRLPKYLQNFLFDGKKLKQLSTGTTEQIAKQFETLVADETACQNLVDKLTQKIAQYDSITGEAFTDKVGLKAKSASEKARDALAAEPFKHVKEAISSSRAEKTIENMLNKSTKDRITGAQSSFYRLLQTIDVFKQIKSGDLKNTLISNLQSSNLPADEKSVEKLIEACKKVMLNATTTDYVEKFTTSGFKLSEGEYKVVMKTLFGEEAGEALKSGMQSTKGQKVLAGLKNYKTQVTEKLVNWQNGITPELQRRVVGDATFSANGVERNNIVGKTVKEFVKDSAKKTYNSSKWLKIFGGAMLALTAITIGAGLLMGRKGETEKKIEKENKVNG